MLPAFEIVKLIFISGGCSVGPADTETAVLSALTANSGAGVVGVSGGVDPPGGVDPFEPFDPPEELPELPPFAAAESPPPQALMLPSTATTQASMSAFLQARPVVDLGFTPVWLTNGFLLRGFSWYCRALRE
jgi:hypothetical protein